MNRKFFHALATTLGIVAITTPAQAVQLTTQVLSIYQVGTSGLVKLGHVVHAHTNYNRLTAGGQFNAQCMNPGTMPVTGGRTESTDNLVGGLTLIVTIPKVQPAHMNMPGFSTLPRGTTLTCTYAWSGFAQEGGYSIGASGISFQTGNGTASESGTQMFTMRVPSLGDPNENSSCLP